MAGAQTEQAQQCEVSRRQFFSRKRRGHFSQSLPESTPNSAREQYCYPCTWILRGHPKVMPSPASVSSVRWEQGDGMGHCAVILSAYQMIFALLVWAKA